jgi:tetratricopeptide (TPR) repeat protein
VASQTAWRGVRAKVLARRGQFDEAIRLAGEAVDVAEPTDHLLIKGAALWDLGEVLRLAGRRDEALEAVRRALAVHEEKGDLASLDRTRELQREIESGSY